MDSLSTYDTDAWLPKIHAVEFLGEPQYGGGRPVAPQEVFDALLPYRTSRLRDGMPDWDLASIAAPDAAVLFALDTAYTADKKDNVFTFGAPRAASFSFELPSHLRDPRDVFRVDADGIEPVTWRATQTGIEIDDVRSRDAIYLATQSPTLRATIEQRRQTALAHETANPIDRPALEAVLKSPAAK